tara:strand:+ start:29142 stop:30158 length:1017 start_codon:yes stop_codon:yes gene_type:complete
MSAPLSQSAQPYEIPIRTNSFFTQLNYDVRCLVYNHLDLPPLSHSFVGFVMSCREALNETEQIAALQVNRYLEGIRVAAAQQGHCLLMPTLPIGSSYANLSEITITCRWKDVSHRYHAVQTLLATYFSRVTFDCKTKQEFKALANASQLASVMVPVPDAPSSSLSGAITGFVDSLERFIIRTSSAKGKAKFIMDRIANAIEFENKLKRNQKAKSGPIHTKTITLIWGDIPKDTTDIAGNQMWAEEQMQFGIKYSETEARERGIESATYPWPTLTTTTHRTNDATGRMTLSAGNRWVDGIDRKRRRKRCPKKQEEKGSSADCWTRWFAGEASFLTYHNH